MQSPIAKDTAWMPSEKVVPRKIKNKLIIVPIEDGVANFNDVMFSFNETGARIWEYIEQKKNLKDICLLLHNEYNAEVRQIEQSVLQLVNTLLDKGIIEEWKKN